MPRSSRDIIVRTESLVDAERFYGTILGFPVSFRGPGLIGFETGSFCLYVQEGPEHGPVLEFLVADVEATRNQLLQSGCILVEEDPSVPRCYLRDPFGLTFNVGKSNSTDGT